MRRRLVATMVLLAAVAMWTSPSEGEQPRSAPQKKGGKGGPGGPGGMNWDPNAMFDRLAKGRDYFLISETTYSRQALTEYAQAKGITDEKISRAHYLAYSEEQKAKGGGVFMMKGKIPGMPGGANIPVGPGASPAIPKPDWGQIAEFDFAKHDLNGKGFLTREEVPGKLREDFDKWDTNRDNVIQLDEYKAWFVARMQERAEREAQRAAQSGNDDDWEKRPTVYRAGKLPPNLPKWFIELDKDGDGQVSLAEWRRAGKEIEEFQKYDRNDDGLLTPQEVLRQEALAKAGATGHEAPSVIQNIVNTQAGPMRIEIRGPDAGRKGGPPGPPGGPAGDYRDKKGGGGKKRMGG